MKKNEVCRKTSFPLTRKNRKMEIKTAEFLVSSSRADQCPDVNGKPEYAFIGRSNVGKSSLINMLTRRKGLAMTSSTPGKTMLVNHFIINNEWYLVDLPGYGYAKRGKKEMEKLSNLISHYVCDREELTCLFVLIDSRLKPQKIDLEFIEWLGEEVSHLPSSSPRPTRTRPVSCGRTSTPSSTPLRKRGKNCRRTSSLRAKRGLAATNFWHTLKKSTFR